MQVNASQFKYKQVNFSQFSSIEVEHWKTLKVEISVNAHTMIKGDRIKDS